MTDPLALLDELDQARAKGTPGEWRQIVDNDTYIGGDFSDDVENYLDVADVKTFTDTAVIVAEHNAVPRLTAALRAAWEVSGPYARDLITAALTPEAADATLAGQHTTDEQEQR